MSKKILYYQHDPGIGKLTYIYKTPTGTVKLTETRDKTDIADVLWQASNNPAIINVPLAWNIKKFKTKVASKIENPVERPINQFFHFQLLFEDKVVIDSQDKLGFKGFMTKTIAKTVASNMMCENCKDVTQAHVFAVAYSDLPTDHTAIQLMADYEMSHTGEYDDNNYDKLGATSKYVNQD